MQNVLKSDYFMNENDDIKTLKILVDGVKSKVDFQLNADNGLDTKSSTLLALIGAVAVFYLGLLGNHYFCFALIPLVLMAVSTYFLLQAIRTRDYNAGLIDVYDETKGYRSMSEHKLLSQLLSDYQKAFDDNSSILKEKNKDYKTALNFFLVSVLLMIVFNFI